MSESRESVLARMINTEGNVFEFVLERTEEAIQRDGLGTTFSQEAVEQLHWEMAAWVGSRLMRAAGRSGSMPQRLVVTVEVELP